MGRTPILFDRYTYDERSTVTTTGSTFYSRAAFRRTGNRCGEQYDPDLGLYYLRARYYNPNTGRFLSRDPGPGDDDSDEADEASGSCAAPGDRRCRGVAARSLGKIGH